MKTFTIFAKDTGEVLRTIQSPDLSTVALNIDATESAIEGDFSADTHRVTMVDGADGEPVPQAIEMPPRPGGYAVFDYANGAWVDDRTDAQKAADLEARRLHTDVSRQNFCLALKRADILPAAEAVAAAKGEWPATFNAVLPALAAQDVDEFEAQIIWASATRVQRAHPMIAALATAANLSPEQVDALFGLAAP